MKNNYNEEFRFDLACTRTAPVNLVISHFFAIRQVDLYAPPFHLSIFGQTPKGGYIERSLKSDQDGYLSLSLIVINN